MKIKFSILYKNGCVDEIIQEITEKNSDKVNNLIKDIKTNFRDDINGFVSFGDGSTSGYFIRLADISRVKTEIIETK